MCRVTAEAMPVSLLLQPLAKRTFILVPLTYQRGCNTSHFAKLLSSTKIGAGMFWLFYPVPYYIPFLVWDALQPDDYWKR